MENFPGNSQNGKQSETAKDEPTETKQVETKKVEKLIVGEVVRRKKPLGRRFKEMMIGGDAPSVWQYVAVDVLLPAAKDAIADAFSQGIERLLFGEARSVGRRTGTRPGGGSFVNYNKVSSPMSRREEVRPTMSRRARATHNFDEIIIPTRAEAEEVLDTLFARLEKYELVSVGDLYGLVGETADFTAEKWGWVDLRGATIRRVGGGYLLDLPKPEPI